MRLSQHVTELVSRDWVPVSVKKWWYREPPAVNDLRVVTWIVIIGGLALIIADKLLS